MVSSGAIAEGMKRLGWAKRPSAVNELQAAAALGGTVEANPAYWRCLPREAQAVFGKVAIGAR